MNETMVKLVISILKIFAVHYLEVGLLLLGHSPALWAPAFMYEFSMQVLHTWFWKQGLLVALQRVVEYVTLTWTSMNSFCIGDEVLDVYRFQSMSSVTFDECLDNGKTWSNDPLLCILRQLVYNLKKLV